MSYFDKIINSKEKLCFELLAIDVYKDIVEEVENDAKYDSSEKKRDRLQELLINRFDKTEDNFVKTVIGYSLISGFYYIPNGLLTVGKGEKYHGNRFEEFSKITFDSAISAVKLLIETYKQYRIANSLFEIAANNMFKKHSSELRSVLFVLIGAITETEIKNEVSTLEFLVPAVNFMLDDRNYLNDDILSIIDTILNVAVSFGDTAPTARSQYNKMGFDMVFPQVFDIKIKFYQKQKEQENVTNTAKVYAHTFEKLAEKRVNLGGVNLKAAIMHLESAIKIYKKYGLINSDELKRAKKRLDEVKSKWSNFDNPNVIKREYNLMSGLSEEQRTQLEQYIQQFSEMSISDRIIFLLDSVPFITEDDVQKRRTHSKENNPFFEVFITTFTNEAEQSVFHDNSEEGKISLALYKHIQISGAALWMHLLDVMWKEKNSIDFAKFISHNELLKTREYYFNKAFTLFFEGDIYSAIYLLIPQVEWWFREVARKSGEQTSNLKDFPVEQAKTLTPIFETDALREYLGKEKYWLFEQLMVHEPMNIRNKAAHGLEFHDNGYCSYFVLCVMKLIFGNRLLKGNN